MKLSTNIKYYQMMCREQETFSTYKFLVNYVPFISFFVGAL